MTSLKVANFLSPIMDDALGPLLERLGSSRELSLEFVGSRALSAETLTECDLGFVCGFALQGLRRAQPQSAPVPIAAPLLVRSVDSPLFPLEVAPLQSKEQPLPEYFGQVLMRADTECSNITELEGLRCCYNEEESFSGYWALRLALQERGKTEGFFSTWKKTGSHLDSVRAVLLKEADCACIDSHVLQMEHRRNPTLSHALRSIESLGPYPMPPLAAFSNRAKEMAEQISNVFVSSKKDQIVETQMRHLNIQSFVPVYSEYYRFFDQIFQGFSECPSFDL